MRYWVTRLAGAVLLLLVISMLTFGAMNVLGDPLFNILGPTAGDVDNPESVIKIEAAKEEYNLDEPLPVRYAIWLGGFVRGDFGVQFSEDGQPPVRDLIVERLPRTLSLVIMAQLMALVIALPWALWSASRANSRVGQGVHGGSVPDDLHPELRAGGHPVVLPVDQTRLVPARVPGRFATAVTVPPTDPAGAHAGPPGRRRLPAAAAHRPDHHPAGGLHPHRQGQGRRAAIDPVQARAAARRCSPSSPSSGSPPAR